MAFSAGLDFAKNGSFHLNETCLFGRGPKKIKKQPDSEGRKN